jgi:hypothetical protein
MAAFIRSRLALSTLLRCAEGFAARFLLTVSVQQQNHDFIFKEG